MIAHSLLLVDDSPEDVQLVLHTLHKLVAKEQIAVVHSGEEALDYLFARGTFAGRNADHHPRIMLLDLNLPRLPGIEVLRQVRANTATRMLPVAVLSASVEQHDIRAAMVAGANSYVRKSLDYAKLNESMTLLARYWLELNISPPSSGHFE